MASNPRRWAGAVLALIFCSLTIWSLAARTVTAPAVGFTGVLAGPQPRAPTPASYREDRAEVKPVACKCCSRLAVAKRHRLRVEERPLREQERMSRAMAPGLADFEAHQRLELVVGLATARVKDRVQWLKRDERARAVGFAGEEKEEVLFVQLTYRR